MVGSPREAIGGKGKGRANGEERIASPRMTIAATIALVLVAAQIVFQLGLAAGKPWGDAAYGGTWPGVLPKGMRINSLVFALAVYPLIALYLIDAGEIAEVDWLPADGVVIWVLVVFFGLGTLANAASRSKIERKIWLVPTAIMFVCTLVLALG